MNAERLVVQQIDVATYGSALLELENLLEQSVSFLQSSLYGQLQERDGKTVVYFVANLGDTTVACGLAVRYTAPLGMNFLYCPYGPVASAWSPQLVTALHAFFKPIARELGCAFVRLDAASEQFDTLTKPVPSKLARTASLQPRAEWLLDITPTQDDLWVGFHKHARYNVRLAERANAELKTFAPADVPLDDFFALMQTTAGRDGFGIFDKNYYQAYLSAMTPTDGFMIMCYIDGKPAAAGLFVTHDSQAHYVFAGSSDDYRKIAPAYAVIWSAIRESKQRGCTVFNFGGVSDAVKGQRLAGVTAFKRRFGGYQTDHQNPTDLICNKLKYAAFSVYKYIH